jgi:hypothetical protein
VCGRARVSEHQSSVTNYKTGSESIVREAEKLDFMDLEK